MDCLYYYCVMYSSVLLRNQFNNKSIATLMLVITFCLMFCIVGFVLGNTHPSQGLNESLVLYLFQLLCVLKHAALTALINKINSFQYYDYPDFVSSFHPVETQFDVVAKGHFKQIWMTTFET